MSGDNILSIYTDGSSAPNPRTGGVGFRMIYPDGDCLDFSPYGYKGATNNEMELQACILALREVVKLEDIRKAESIAVYTDSQYVCANYQNAMFTWPKQKWVRSNGEPVLNTKQWKELIRLMHRIGAKFKVYANFFKVKAHSGHEHNEAVDKLADRSRESPYARAKISTSNVRRRTTVKKTVRGSIKGEGQRIRIRIISTSWLSEQQIFRFRSEVLSRKSNYFGNVDFIISDQSMSAGHKYDVILVGGLDYCRIQKIIKEVKKISKR